MRVGHVRNLRAGLSQPRGRPGHQQAHGLVWVMEGDGFNCAGLESKKEALKWRLDIKMFTDTDPDTLKDSSLFLSA